MLRQPFTETDENGRTLIQGVMDSLNSMKDDFHINFLTPCIAYDAHSFKRNFEQMQKKEFNPVNFREYRLSLLKKADAFIVIRTAMSESSAFEIAYNLYSGNNAPIFFAVEANVDIKTTLLRDIENAVYVRFSSPCQLIEPFKNYFKSIQNNKSLKTTN